MNGPYDLKIKIKNNKYLRIFIINHKNTVNIIYPDIQLGRCWRTMFRENIRPPCQVATRNFREDCA